MYPVIAQYHHFQIPVMDKVNKKIKEFKNQFKFSKVN